MEAAKKDTHTDFWAFSTTIWEIFARGKSPAGISPEILRQNYNRDGAILPQELDCPEAMFETMMDGWSMQQEEQFNHQKIFQAINNAMPQYQCIEENLNDTSQTESDDIESQYGADDVCESFFLLLIKIMFLLL